MLDFSRLGRRKLGEGRKEKVNRRALRGVVDGVDVEVDGGVSEDDFLVGVLDLSFEGLSTRAEPFGVGEREWMGMGTGTDVGAVVSLGWTTPLVNVDGRPSSPLFSSASALAISE